MISQDKKIPNKYNLVAYITPISALSENTRVQLDASKSYYELSTNSKEDVGATTITSRSIMEKEDGISYIWKQISGPSVNLENANTATPSFISPFVDIDNKDNGEETKIYTILKFELVIKDKDGQKSTLCEEVIVKIVQKAIVLQGGGALGAYEVGVVKALVDNLIKRKEKNGNGNYKNNRPLFDIVAGTSIGAVNAAIIMGNLIKLRNENQNLNQSEIWKNAIKELETFWQEISDPLTLLPEWIKNTPYFKTLLNNLKTSGEYNSSLFDAWWHFIRRNREILNKNYSYISKESKLTNDNIKNFNDYWNLDMPYYVPVLSEEFPYFKWISSNDNWKEEQPYIQSYFYWPENYGSLATVEGLRRYYSVAASLLFGTPKVLTPSIPQPDRKFFGPNFIRMDNTPLLRTIKKYWDYDKFPIKTSFKNHEPRLLLVSVDALDATSPVAFDSYYDDNKDIENSICKTEYGDEEYKHIIEYKDGIKSEHVMASMSVHFKHRYPNMKVKSKIGTEEGSPEIEDRYFWDGAYLSNTPLREVLYGHRHYWRDMKNIQVTLENGTTEILVPDMEIYVINLYPPLENELPMDADSIQDREMDIKVHDKTKDDVRLAEIFTDYIEFIEQLESLAYKHSEEDKDLKREIDNLLDKVTRSTTRFGLKPRKYRDIVKGRFDITKVTYIERSDDGNTIFGKATDFSSKTVMQLMEAGYDEAQNAIEIEDVREMINELTSKEVIHSNKEDERRLPMERKLQTSIIHAKHQNLDKSITELHDLIEYAKDILRKTTSHNISQKSIDKTTISEFIKLIYKLEIQLMISKITLMVNKDIITEKQGQHFKQKLQQIKSSINDQHLYKDVETELQQFITEVNMMRV